MKPHSCTTEGREWCAIVAYKHRPKDRGRWFAKSVAFLERGDALSYAVTLREKPHVKEIHVFEAEVRDEEIHVLHTNEDGTFSAIEPLFGSRSESEDIMGEMSAES